MKQKYERFIVCSDVHGDQQDKAANEVLFSFMKDWNPTIRIFAGDLWDFRPLRKKCSDEEKRESMEDDYIAGVTWLEKFKPTRFLRGNHDERLWKLIEENRGVLSDYAYKATREIEELLRRMECPMLPWDARYGILRLGHLKVLHGFYHGQAATKMTAITYGSTLFGHIHAIDEHAINGLERRVSRSIGCLCNLDMDYEAHSPSKLRKAHGFAYGLLCRATGKYHLVQAEDIDGHWLIPTDFKEYR